MCKQLSLNEYYSDKNICRRLIHKVLVCLRYVNVLKPAVFVCGVFMVNSNIHELCKEIQFLRGSPLPQTPFKSTSTIQQRWTGPPLASATAFRV